MVSVGYAEYEAQQNTTSATYVDACTLTFDADAGDYIIIANCEISHSVATSSTLAQLYVESTDRGNVTIEPPYLPGFWTPTGWIYKTTFAAGSRTIKVRFSAEAGTSYIRNVHIYAWKAPTFEYAESNTEQSITTTEADRCTLTFTPGTTQDYLVLASGSIRGASTTNSSKFRLKVDGVEKNYVLIESGDTTDYRAHTLFLVQNLDTTSHTIKITGQSESGTMYVKDLRIAAVPLSTLTTYKSSDETETTTISLTYVDKLSYSPTISTATNHIILGTSVCFQLAGVERWNNLVVDSTQYNEIDEDVKDPSDIQSFFGLKRLNLSAASHTFKIQHKTANASYAVTTKNARLLAIQEPTGATQYEKTHTTDSLIYAVQTKTHDTDSLIYLQSTQEHDTDSYSVSRVETTHTTDSLIYAVQTKDHNTDSLVFLQSAPAHTTDSLIYLQTTKNHDTDLYSVIRTEITHTTDSLIYAVQTKDHNTDSLVLKTDTREHTTDSFISGANLKPHDTDSLIKGTQTQEHSTDTYSVLRNTSTHTTDSYSVIRTEITYDTDSLIYAVQTQGHDTDSFVSAGNVRTHTTDSLIKGTQVNTHSTDSLIYLQSTQEHDTDLLIKGTQTKDHDTDSYSVSRVQESHTTDSLIKGTQVNTHSTDALVKGTQTKDHNTDSYVLFGTIKTHDTDAYIIEPILHGQEPRPWRIRARPRRSEEPEAGKYEIDLKVKTPKEETELGVTVQFKIIGSVGKEVRFFTPIIGSAQKAYRSFSCITAQVRIGREFILSQPISGRAMEGLEQVVPIRIQHIRECSFDYHITGRSLDLRLELRKLAAVMEDADLMFFSEIIETDCAHLKT